MAMTPENSHLDLDKGLDKSLDKSQANLRQSLKAVQERMQAAAKKAGRNVQSITLLAASKAKPAADIRAISQLGITDIAENYVAEALAKQAQLLDVPALCWHFIGRIQSNKTADIAAHFDWVQSLDRLKVAKRLAAARPKAKPPLNICVQVNVSKEPQKAGVQAEDALALCQQLVALPNLQLRGLMAVPRAGDAATSAAFSELTSLQASIAEALSLPSFDTLSMGMSADFEQAIIEGSTMVRIGSALFGART